MLKAIARKIPPIGRLIQQRDDLQQEINELRLRLTAEQHDNSHIPQPTMTKHEIALFDSLIACSQRYVEFGAGGSTCRAAATAKEWIISTDASTEWIEKVRAHCNGNTRLLHVDIGPVGVWSFPQDPGRRNDWPAYHERVWDESGGVDADLYFIDGRFRVACFMQAVLRARRPDAVYAMHDFSDRPYYHVVRSFVREIATSETLSAFIRLPGFDRVAAMSVLEEHRYDPS